MPFTSRIVLFVVYFFYLSQRPPQSSYLATLAVDFVHGVCPFSWVGFHGFTLSSAARCNSSAKSVQSTTI